MPDIKFSYNEVAAYITIINIVLGLLFASFPLITGLIMKNRNYAVYGFICSLLGGAILGVFLAYPIAVIFTWLILRRLKNVPVEVAETDENPVDVQVENSENL